MNQLHYPWSSPPGPGRQSPGLCLSCLSSFLLQVNKSRTRFMAVWHMGGLGRHWHLYWVILNEQDKVLSSRLVVICLAISGHVYQHPALVCGVQNGTHCFCHKPTWVLSTQWAMYSSSGPGSHLAQGTHKLFQAPSTVSGSPRCLTGSRHCSQKIRASQILAIFRLTCKTIETDGCTPHPETPLGEVWAEPGNLHAQQAPR